MQNWYNLNVSKFLTSSSSSSSSNDFGLCKDCNVIPYYKYNNTNKSAVIASNDSGGIIGTINCKNGLLYKYTYTISYWSIYKNKLSLSSLILTI